jgi:acetate---CoA ligase (ADP-forming)
MYYINSMKMLTNQNALDFLRLYDIPTLNYKSVSGHHEVNKFPVVLKLDSPKIIHKSERKGVHIIHHKEHAKKSFHKLRKQGQVISQQHIEGHELTIQILKPPKGRSIILLGLSGIPLDIHETFSVRTCPIKLNSARKMIEELRSFDYISKFEGKKSRLDSLERSIVSLSNLAVKEKVKSLEIDPFVMNHKWGGAVDAKIVKC